MSENLESKTAIYVRVSTTKQSQKDSPEHQEGICKEKARQLSLDVNEENIYEDRDTGTNIISRSAIQQLIKDAQKRKFYCVIFASLSRFSRDTMDSLALKRTLVDSLGVRLISLDEGYDSFVDKDELKFQIISAVNQKVSEQISLSSKRGIRQSALKGNFIGSKPPFGYIKNEISGRKSLVPDENAIGIVKLIFKLYTSEKMGEKKITLFLNDENIPSSKGGLWGISSIQRILQNEAYIGVNVFGKHESKTVYKDINNLSDRKKILVQRKQSDWERAHVEQTHEAIIDKEIFILAQEIRLQRGGGKRGGIRNNKNVFAGIIKCAHCESAMVSTKSKGGQVNTLGQEYRYLLCSRRRRMGEKGCINGFWLAYYPFKDDLIETISNKIGKITSSESLFEKFKGLIEVDNIDNEKHIKNCEKQIENNRKLLFELRKEKMSSGMDEQQYEYEKQQYETELTQLEKRLTDMRKSVAKKDNLSELYEEIKDSLDDLLSLNYDDEDEFDELRIILMKLLELITVDQDGNVVVKTTFGI